MASAVAPAAAATTTAPSSASSSSQQQQQGGYYCSTSGTLLEDRAALQEHYKSDFHRYNLKRKVAGLPPVTREWFEARRAQLLSGAAAPSGGALAGPVQGSGSAGAAAPASAAAAAPVPPGHVRVWYDPLLRKTFRTEQTYLAHTRSNKFLEAVRRSGQEAPPAVVSLRKLQDADAAGDAAADGNKAAPRNGQVQATPGFKVVKPSGGLPLRSDEEAAAAQQQQQQLQQPRRQEFEHDDDDEEDDEEEGSGWETASDDDVPEEELAAFAAAEQQRQAKASSKQQQQAAAAGSSARKWAGRGDAAAEPQGGAAAAAVEQEEGEEEEEEEWEDWDVRRSLFDTHVSRDLEGNLEYMWLKYGFYLPDAQYLRDPEGLIKYLGAKLRYGRVPLYARGDDASARQFRSLHGVQRHMVDSGRCKMCYEDNEDEYADFYDYEDDEEEEGNELALAAAPAVVSAGGYELAVPGTSASASAGGGRVLGHREFARFYRQRHRAVDDRQIVLVNTMLSKYRSLGISLKDEAVSLERKKLKSKTRSDFKWEGKRAEGLFMRGNVNRNLPKNVPF